MFFSAVVHVVLARFGKDEANSLKLDHLNFAGKVQVYEHRPRFEGLYGACCVDDGAAKVSRMAEGLGKMISVIVTVFEEAGRGCMLKENISGVVCWPWYPTSTT